MTEGENRRVNEATRRNDDRFCLIVGHASRPGNWRDEGKTKSKLLFPSVANDNECVIPGNGMLRNIQTAAVLPSAFEGRQTLKQNKLKGVTLRLTFSRETDLIDILRFEIQHFKDL